MEQVKTKAHGVFTAVVGHGLHDSELNLGRLLQPWDVDYMPPPTEEPPPLPTIHRMSEWRWDINTNSYVDPVSGSSRTTLESWTVHCEARAVHSQAEYSTSPHTQTTSTAPAQQGTNEQQVVLGLLSVFVGIRHTVGRVVLSTTQQTLRAIRWDDFKRFLSLTAPPKSLNKRHLRKTVEQVCSCADEPSEIGPEYISLEAIWETQFSARDIFVLSEFPPRCTNLEQFQIAQHTPRKQGEAVSRQLSPVATTPAGGHTPPKRRTPAPGTPAGEDTPPKRLRVQPSLPTSQSQGMSTRAGQKPVQDTQHELLLTKENVYVVIEAQWKEENGFTVYQALSLEEAVDQNSGRLVYRPKTAKQLLPFTWLRDQKPGELKFTNASRDPVLDLSVNGQHLWEGEGVMWAKAVVKTVGQGAKNAAFVMLEDEVQQIRRLHERLSNAEGRD